MANWMEAVGAVAFGAALLRLEWIQQRQGKTLAKLPGGDAMIAQCDSLNATATEHGKRLDAHSQWLDAHSQRLDAQGSRCEALEQRQGVLASALQLNSQRVSIASSRLDTHAKRLGLMPTSAENMTPATAPDSLAQGVEVQRKVAVQ